MSFDTPFTKENLDLYLKELGKDFRRLNGKKTPAEIILVGGAAVLANYGFREMTYDIDALIIASSAMKDAINQVSNRLGLPASWLNMDFKKTRSYSNKLIEVSVYYKTFSNILKIRTVDAQYLIAMKLMSAREYKNDLPDVAGILLEHQKKGEPIDRQTVDKAICTLYGEKAELPLVSKIFIDNAFLSGDYKQVYLEIRASEKRAKETLLAFKKDNKGELKEDNIASILEKAKKKLAEE